MDLTMIRNTPHLQRFAIARWENEGGSLAAPAIAHNAAGVLSRVSQAAPTTSGMRNHKR